MHVKIHRTTKKITEIMIQIIRKVWIGLIFILISSVVPAQGIFEPVKWAYSAEKISNSEVELIFKASIEDKWHLYSQDISISPPATVFSFQENDGYELAGEVIEESEAIEEYDPNFEMVLKYFGHEAIFKQKAKLLTDKRIVIKGFVEYMSCDDVRCLPPTEDEFKFVFNAGQEPLVKEGKPEKEGTEISTEEIIQPVREIDDKQEVTSVSYTDEKSMWEIIIEAILWGFVALLTPCVFPMIPMTISFFMKGGQSKAAGKFQATTYGLSIVLLYTIPIAVIILITYFVGGKTVTADIFNWLSTHWIPNIFFFLVFIIFAASFLGMFEIVLPGWMVNKADKKADKGGILGAFFMALTLVIVSFSCTGPLVGTVLVKSAQGEIFEPIFAMLAFSIAFALPFTLFAFFPSWLQGLPKSGGWLNSVKVVLGFIELALGLKFLSVADQTYHWGLLDREVYLALWIVIFTLMGFYLLGKLKFAHDSPLKYIPVPRLFLAVITFAFVIYLVPGMFGAPLKMLSGYLPPQSTHDFDLNEIIRNNAKSVIKSTMKIDDKKSMEALCEEPKYSDFLHLPHGLEGYFDYEQALDCAKKLNKPIFVDFTGHGCVNCREMEANVWADPEVLQRLRDDYVIVALYVDDKTRLDESEWVKSDYDGKVKKSIGKKFADFQISRFGTNAQPYYCLLDHEGNLLVKPRAYDRNVGEFVEFLDKGQKEFKERQKN